MSYRRITASRRARWVSDPQCSRKALMPNRLLFLLSNQTDKITTLQERNSKLESQLETATVTLREGMSRIVSLEHELAEIRTVETVLDNRLKSCETFVSSASVSQSTEENTTNSKKTKHFTFEQLDKMYPEIICQKESEHSSSDSGVSDSDTEKSKDSHETERADVKLDVDDIVIRSYSEKMVAHMFLNRMKWQFEVKYNESRNVFRRMFQHISSVASSCRTLKLFNFNINDELLQAIMSSGLQLRHVEELEIAYSELRLEQNDLRSLLNSMSLKKLTLNGCSGNFSNEVLATFALTSLQMVNCTFDVIDDRTLWNLHWKPPKHLCLTKTEANFSIECVEKLIRNALDSRLEPKKFVWKLPIQLSERENLVKSLAVTYLVKLKGDHLLVNNKKTGNSLNLVNFAVKS